MLTNYLKTAFRNLIRERTSSTINIAGLTLGITCGLVLFLLIRHLSSFDNYHSKRDRIYRVVNQSDGNQGMHYTSGVPSVLPDAFRIDFPEVEEVVFTSYRNNGVITIRDTTGLPTRYAENDGIVYTQSNFFTIFDRPILSGRADGALDAPHAAVISERWALRYFGREDVLGEVLEFDSQEYQITAVMDDYPPNTDFPFDLMLSYITIKSEREKNGWNSIWSSEQCYFLLGAGEPIEKMQSRMASFTDKYIGEDNPDNSLFLIQPLSEIHFDKRFGTFSTNTVSRGVLLAFGAIGLILILTACINFINLSTAEAIKRSREVGIRKVLGGTRGQLIRQFLGETSLITSLAMICSLALTQLSLTLLNPYLDLNIAMNFWEDGILWVFIFASTVAISVLSGLYPAFVVSGFKPALALKNLISNKNSSGYNLRRALVVTQFFISQFFIIGTIIVINQLEYFQEKDLGFKKDAVIVLPVPQGETPAQNDGVSKMRTLRAEVARIPGVLNASLNSSPPSSGHVAGTNFSMVGKDETYGTQVKVVDGNYLDLFQLELVAGGNIADGDTATGFVVNEKLARTVGFDSPNEIIGKEIKMWGKTLPVVGVVRNFHTVSLRKPIEATLLMNRMRGYESLSLQVNPTQIQPIVGQLKTIWEAAYPEHIFDYHFLDEKIREFYEGEQKMSLLFGIFSAIAIFIGCLGLFGLATFMANQKMKEIGVRKVLGASVESIVLLFSKEYVKLILIGFLLSAPLTWIAMNSFLEEFAYKVRIGPETFFIGLGVTLLIAMLTVGFRSFRAAIVNPTISLRSE